MRRPTITASLFNISRRDQLRRPAIINLEMDRLRSGFHHRKSRKDSPSRPTIITDTTSSGKTTPEQATCPQQPLQVPGVPTKKPSPFRALRDLSRSHKRARSPAPGSETNSPVSAISAVSALSARDSPIDHYTSSPHPLSAVTPDAKSMASYKKRGSSAGPAPKMPSFLTLSPSEIDAKFQDIQWAERNRMMQSVTYPSPSFRWARVTGDHLKKLDRYMNIQPWQNNRVHLRVPPGKQDYINASPISLPSIARPGGGATEALAVGGPDRYIAMQGPKQKTTGHVWRMVVEQLESPAVIVMLTETHEGNMEKCYPYFPRSPDSAPIEVNRKDEFGDGFRASVRCEAIEETEAGDAIELRKLVVRVYKAKAAHRKGEASPDNVAEVPAVEFPVDENGDVKMLSPNKVDHDDDSPSDGTETASVTVEVGRAPGDADDKPAAKDESPEHEYEERTVWHFLYKKWPDFGVPALEDIDSFFTLMRLSREKNADPTNPRIVHCSAGVGRSGTFIALEHLMREMDAGVLEDWDRVASHYSRQQMEHQQPDGGSAGVGDSDAASMEGHNGHPGDDKVEEEDAVGGGGQKMDVEEGQEASGAGQGGGEAGATELDDLIFHTVNQLREQRRHMVQAEPQFHFLYQVVRKLWEDRYGSPETGGGNKSSSNRDSNSSSHHHVSTVVSEHPPRIQTPDGEPAAKRLEFDPFVEE